MYIEYIYLLFVYKPETTSIQCQLTFPQSCSMNVCLLTLCITQNEL